ncbi:MAG: hypothetical protein AB7W59_01805 [Acidimicrobiia bacterium]
MTRPDDLEAVALAELADRVEKRKAAVRALAGADLADGDKRTIRSPLDGSALGSILRTDPDPKWRVAEPHALEQWLRTQHPSGIEHGYLLHVPGVDGPVWLDPLDELCVVMCEHAPHLLTAAERPVAQEVEHLLEQSRVQGTPAAPGIELVKPAGSVRVVRAKTCGAAIERLVQAGQLSWDWRPQLSAGDEAVAS